MARFQSNNGSQLSRRDWLRLSAAGVAGFSASGWLETLAADTANHPQRRHSCILLWMNGGPSQNDTFDLKPGHANGGPYKEIATAVPGIRISEHLPRLAKHMDKMVLVRSMSTKEGDHGRASFLMRTGYLPQGPIEYPSLGALVAKELGSDRSELPSFVSIGPYRFFNPAAYGAGFLGPTCAPLIVGENGVPTPGQQGDNNYEQALKVQDLDLPRDVSPRQAEARVQLLQGLEERFVMQHPGVAPLSHQTAYNRAVRLMRSAASRAFNLEEEPAALRDAYGRNQFGQGCLLARRLVELGVPFVEVTLGGLNGQVFGWDTHQENFNAVKDLSQVLDPAWSTLMEDLKVRGLLSSTLIVWMGEFGRTPKINPQRGRDHFPNAWSTVLAGGSIQGGRVVGRTSPDGMSVADRPVPVPDFLATICQSLGIDTMKMNVSNVGRPIRIVDKSAKPIQEILA
ncbi:MAG TPA: DUF1501 domain-containing protein [Gemmataceae bacterium]|nr:DUF1501 domain-containing protein [Gemmataceae bacterium]